MTPAGDVARGMVFCNKRSTESLPQKCARHGRELSECKESDGADSGKLMKEVVRDKKIHGGTVAVSS